VKTPIAAGTSSFATTTTLAGARSFAGVQSNDNFFDVGSTALAGDLNVFDWHDYGIHLTNVTSVIKNNKFIQLDGTFYISQPTVPYGVGIYSIGATYTNLTVGATTANHKNTFQDVFRGVHVEGNNQTQIIGNTFTNSSTLPAGSPPLYKTIGEHGIAGLNILEIFTASNNTLTNCAASIDLMRNTVSPTLNPTINMNNNSILRTSAGYCDYGIYLSDVSNSLTGNQVNINNNIINYSRVEGIHASNINNDATVSFNDVTMLYQSGTVDVWGIKAEYSNSINILVNCVRTTLSTNYTATSNPNIRGIYVNSSLDWVIRCNQVFKVGHCLEFEGNCTSSQLTNSATTLQTKGLEGNTIYNCRVGLYLKTSGMTPSVIGQQGSASNPMGNRWSGSTSTFFDGITYVENGSTALNSKIYCLSTVGNDAYPTSNHQGTGVIYVAPVSIVPTTGTEYTCGSTPCSNSQIASQGSISSSPSISSQQSNLVQMLDTADYGSQNPGYWNKKQYVYQQLRNNNQLLSNSTLQAFYNNNVNSAIGKLELAEEKIQAGQYSAASALNNGFSATNIMEQNAQALNNIILKPLLNSGYSFTAQDLSDLSNIASQCPAEGGKAIIQARNYLMMLNRKIMTFANYCVTSQRVMESSLSDPGAGTFNMYPNPNDGNMKLDYSVERNAELQIIDLTGKVMCSYQLSAVNHSLSINCEGLSNGVYLYKVVYNGELLNTGKITIIK
jgi:hypothetical protein